MKPLDLTKPIQTRDGRPARVICSDRRACFPIVALILDTDSESISFHTKSGKCESSETRDLINVPVKHVREYWGNFYRNRNGDQLYDSESEAIAAAGMMCIARAKKITIEFEEGQGL